jgi:hypothetical protein
MFNPPNWTSHISTVALSHLQSSSRVKVTRALVSALRHSTFNFLMIRNNKNHQVLFYLLLLFPVCSHFGA